MYHVTISSLLVSLTFNCRGVTGSGVSKSTHVRVSVTNVSTGPPLGFERISPTAGYIHTPGWGYFSLHPQNMDSIVRVDVPETHRAMVTQVHVSLTGTRDGCDRTKVTLVIYEDNTMNEIWDCSVPRTMKRQYLSPGADLYVHFQSGDSQQTGFKLFFSISKKSEQLHQVFPDVWNCSVPNFEDFKPHFPCDLQPQCVNKEDERDCPYFSEACGLGFVTLGNRCLVSGKGVFEKGSWWDMHFNCAKGNGRLPNLQTHDDYDILVKYLRPLNTLDVGFIMVGLHSPSDTFPMMYRQEVLHTDDTMAFYRRTQIVSRTNSHCGLLRVEQMVQEDGSNIALSFCTTIQPDVFLLCEIPERSEPESILEKIHLVSVSNASRLTLVGCPLGHVARGFLACDAKTTCWSHDVSSCAAPLTPLPPSLTCANGFESVPYTLVCDVRPDCGDGSDESFCEFPPCDLRTPFYCSDFECVPQSTVCDGQKNCHNGVDEDLCSYDDWVGWNVPVDRPLPPALVSLDNNALFTVQKMTESELADLSPAVCPETHFQCPDNGYCMPVFLRCNGVYDCLGKKDEVDCDSYACPGFYRCRHSQVCVHPEHLCDDIFQCPQNDDELLCDLICPENCTCYGLAFYCRQVFQAANFTKVRFLDSLGSGMRVSDLTENVMMIYLSVAANGLTTVGELNFPNLRFLDLSDNQLREINLYNLRGVPQLDTLTLSGNPLVSVFQCVSMVEKVNGTTHSKNLTISLSLRTLDLSRVTLKVVDSSFLSSLPNLHTVNMSGGGVDKLLAEGFQALTLLRTLDLRGCPLTYFPRGLLRGLQQLETVLSDNYKLCCPASLPAGFVLKNCHAPSDEISSCEALLRSNSFRVCLAIFAFLTLFGNTISFIYRLFVRNRKKLLSFDVFVVHLCMADFLMGVYLSIIGMADLLYQGTYLWEDNTWKSSTACHMAGFLSLVSSEVSALVICLITIDRFLVIRFPFSTFHFGTRSAQMASFGIWGLGGLIAAVPFLPWVAHWQLYSQTGICIPLPISRPDSPGYSYAFGVMILANFVFFLVIAAGQFFIYWSVHSNSLSSTETTRKTQDPTIARRLVTVAMSDFLCWFPIGLLGILASTGTPISGEVNVAMAIFVVPLNSALNPFLYTLNIMLEKRRKVADEKIKERLLRQFQTNSTEDKVEGNRDG